MALKPDESNLILGVITLLIIAYLAFKLGSLV